MSGGEIAAIIVAAAVLLLVGALMVPILKLRHTVDAATAVLNDLSERTGPLLQSVNTTVDNVNTALGQTHVTLDGVNAQLARVDTITGHAQHVTTTAANLATVVGAAAANPLVKVAAFGYGVRKAHAMRRHAETEREVRSRMKAARKARRSARHAAGGEV